jgi:hypothetical protein
VKPCLYNGSSCYSGAHNYIAQVHVIVTVLAYNPPSRFAMRRIFLRLLKVKMHRALALDFILQSIVSKLDRVDGYEYAHYLPLMLVNHSFCEHVLDKLWEHPPLWDLAQCMDHRSTYIQDISKSDVAVQATYYHRGGALTSLVCSLVRPWPGRA